MPEEIKGTLLEKFIEGVVQIIRSGKIFSFLNDEQKEEVKSIVEKDTSVKFWGELNVFERACAALFEEYYAKSIAVCSMPIEKLAVSALLEAKNAAFLANFAQRMEYESVRGRVISALNLSSSEEVCQVGMCVCGESIIIPKNGIMDDKSSMAFIILSQLAK